MALASSVSLEVMTYMDMPAQGSLSAYDPEGDEITYEITSYAAHGRIRLTDRHTGAYLYTPDAGYVGNDEFRYVVRDRYGNYSTAATVSVRVHAIPTAVTFADTEGSTCAAAALRLGEAGIMNGIRVAMEVKEMPCTGKHLARTTSARISRLHAPSSSPLP